MSEHAEHAQQVTPLELFFDLVFVFTFTQVTTLLSHGGGSALYLFAYVALRLRVARTLSRGRLAAAIACALLFPAATAVPALVALTLVAAVWIAFHAYELIWWREERARTRALRVRASAS